MTGIYLDSRVGSRELAPLFRPYGIQPKLRELEFGDIAFEGNGPAGRCAICIERKVIADLVACIEDRRLSGHQLPGMAEQYDYVYLVVEGLWRPGPEGGLQMGKAQFNGERTLGGYWFSSRQRLLYRAVNNYLTTLELRAGVVYRRTLSPEETVAMTVDLWRWWQEKAWDEHSSHLAVYAPARTAEGRGRLQLMRREVPLAERWALQMEGVGQKLAGEVARHFGSAQALANATEKDWQQIDGVGKVTARKAVRDIHAKVQGSIG